MLLLSTASLSLEVSMMEMPRQIYSRWLIVKAVKNSDCACLEWLLCKTGAVADCLANPDTEVFSESLM